MANEPKKDADSSNLTIHTKHPKTNIQKQMQSSSIIHHVTEIRIPSYSMTWSAGKWWRRASAALKDKRSLYFSRLSGGGHLAAIESAVITATTHDHRSIDYKNAARVFSWARSSSSSLSPLMRSLARRATRTRSWPVALKTLLLSHGILLCSSSSSHLLGRLPFDLSNFRDFSASPGFSAFVRAYFHYLDHRSVFLSSSYPQLDMVSEMQDLLDLLIQIQPYADGMAVGLILEAMDCVIIEIFDIYGKICSAIDPNSTKTGIAGLGGMRILRRAAEQREKLSSYFKLCRSLGVLNAAEIPLMETIPGGVMIAEAENCYNDQVAEIVGTEKWVVFEDENPFFCLQEGYRSSNLI